MSGKMKGASKKTPKPSVGTPPVSGTDRFEIQLSIDEILTRMTKRERAVLAGLFHRFSTKPNPDNGLAAISGPEMAVLNSLVDQEPALGDKAFKTASLGEGGYLWCTEKEFDALVESLHQKGFIERGDAVRITRNGIDALRLIAAKHLTDEVATYSIDDCYA